MGFIIKVFLLLVSWMLYILKSVPCTDVIRVGSIPSTAGVILGLGRIFSCLGAFAFSKGKLKGDFNPVYLTQFVLSFNNYESFLKTQIPSSVHGDSHSVCPGVDLRNRPFSEVPREILVHG